MYLHHECDWLITLCKLELQFSANCSDVPDEVLNVYRNERIISQTKLIYLPTVREY